jgi:DNA-binding MarR family transcriptional regulator
LPVLCAARRREPKPVCCLDPMPKISTADYRSLAAFRHEMRKFLAFSEHAARAAGVEPQQHQMLLAVRGLPEGLRPTIGVLAERLCVKHHTAVALVDKLESNGLIQRERSAEDRREVLLRLTREGDALLRALSSLHRAQLQTSGPSVIRALQGILDGSGKTSEPAPSAPRTTSAPRPVRKRRPVSGQRLSA